MRRSWPAGPWRDRSWAASWSARTCSGPGGGRCFAVRASVRGFLRAERSVAAHGRAPLLSPRVLHAPGRPGAAAALFLAMVTYGGYLFSMALHLQAGLGESPAHAGLVFVPAALGFAVTGLTWRLLPARRHHRF
jgi:hypothetical protein